tara:strand:- start:102 stop:347 length:246 start_codon:yes stop_codon:yes gene_type:complete
MEKLKFIVSFLVIPLSFSLMGCSSSSKSSSTLGLFDTKIEAEKAAKDFHCTGAHQMGGKWMPCQSHDAHERVNEHSGHHHH